MKLYKKKLPYLLTLVVGLLVCTGLSTTSVAADSNSAQPPVQDDSNKSSSNSTDVNNDNNATNDQTGKSDQTGTDDTNTKNLSLSKLLLVFL